MNGVENRKYRNIHGEGTTVRTLSRTLKGPSKKTQTALALAVSLWIANGGVSVSFMF